jgi:Ca2+-binding EF-hand superfamily protein
VRGWQAADARGRILKKTLILSVVFGLAPAVAAAQADRFRALDRNGDGFISSQEWYGQGRAPVPFTVVDVDGDGRISEAELRDWSAARGGATRMGLTSADRFRLLDRNRDRFVSPEEWNDAGFGSVPFEAVDSDRDGKISAREFSDWDRRRGGPAATTPAPPQQPGTAAAPLAERLRTEREAMRGTSGVGSRVGTPGPSTSTPPPTAAPPAALSTSPGASPGASPSMSTGSGLTK